MIESGLLDDLDAVFGTHLFPTYPTGSSAIVVDMRWQAERISSLSFKEQVVMDLRPIYRMIPIVAGAHFVTAIQTVVSRG